MNSRSSARLLEYGILSSRLATFVLLCVETAVAQTTYHVTDLGTLGGNNSVPQGVNNRGQVAGFAETPDIDPTCGCPVIHAFLWEEGVMQDLGTLGGRNSAAAGINPEGEVAGYAEIPVADPNFPPFLEHRAFLWEKGLMTDLGTFGGPDGFAAGINEVGQVVGAADVNGTPVPPLSIPLFSPSSGKTAS